MKKPTTCGVSTDARSKRSVADVTGIVADLVVVILEPTAGFGRVTVTVRPTRNGRVTCPTFRPSVLTTARAT